MSAASSFVWQVPTRAVCGAGALHGLGPETAALGGVVAAVVDVRAAQLPPAADALAVLAAHGVPPVAVHEVAGPPTLESVRELAAALGRSGADAVLALGGGSTMDAAKAAALAATNPGLLDDPRWAAHGVVDLDAPGDERARPGLPTLLVPSTAATGSELNGVAALRNAGRKRLLVSGLLAPSTAIVDPALTAALPAARLAEGGVETLCRIVCPYLASGAALGTTDALAEALAAHCLRAVAAACGAPASDASRPARADLAWLVSVSATQLPGLGREPWGHVLWYLQDAVADLAGTAKGPAMAALLPAYLAEAAAGGVGARWGTPGRLARLARALAPELGPDAHADLPAALARRLEEWNLPADLSGLGLDGAAVGRAAADTHRAWGRTGLLDGVGRGELAGFYHRARRFPGATVTPAGGSAPGRSPDTPAIREGR
ncbi:iron-containing alcohol dehydrogenase [Streptomonospora wellingtoniae]|uniref:Iron-containing alcohol dehydrogenase n=1 Tax=Streptomonospora wellingtoniae TaxID=3075544 RepID=A0ABU2KS04_9ACTN|nr:iron-containing alcohol dehydrogenase [Streptomonospora sp. DSM 45055]MDT0301898.1 iron-containing alcohol dehydrogenase [Streptomonospora sp. DSM 45055]